jgi:hypothetical protein
VLKLVVLNAQHHITEHLHAAAGEGGGGAEAAGESKQMVVRQVEVGDVMMVQGSCSSREQVELVTVNLQQQFTAAASSQLYTQT